MEVQATLNSKFSVIRVKIRVKLIESNDFKEKRSCSIRFNDVGAIKTIFNGPSVVFIGTEDEIQFGLLF